MNQENSDKSPPFRRVHYYQGQLLTSTDLQAEQTYHREKHRLQNRLCYGWGIVCGLDVSLNPRAVRVEPGVAFDCLGNEIIVPAIVDVPLPESKTSQYLVLAYTEKPCCFVPVPGDPDNPSQPTRIEESYTLGYSTDDPCGNHGSPGKLCGVCDEAHGIPLAKLNYRRSGWSVQPGPRSRQSWWKRLLAILFPRKNWR